MRLIDGSSGIEKTKLKLINYYIREEFLWEFCFCLSVEKFFKHGSGGQRVLRSLEARFLVLEEKNVFDNKSSLTVWWKNYVCLLKPSRFKPWAELWSSFPQARPLNHSLSRLRSIVREIRVNKILKTSFPFPTTNITALRIKTSCQAPCQIQLICLLNNSGSKNYLQHVHRHSNLARSGLHN